jgi:starch synthase/alpha-amylase
VANGGYQNVFREIVSFHRLHERVAIYDFDFHLEHQAYAACDFILMPSGFEPCGLPQMIAPIYGTLPVAHDTGGIHDTISHLDVARNRGNGFLFKNFDSSGLLWAIKQAMDFYNLPEKTKAGQISRIMQESTAAFNHANTARQYIKLYEKMLKRPLIRPNVPKTGSKKKSDQPQN